MSNYLIMFTFTAKGLETIADVPKRVEKCRHIISKLGGELVSFYGILGGSYDTMFLLRAPDDEKFAAITLAIAKLGNVRTQGFHLFTESEFKKILNYLPAAQAVEELAMA